MKFLKTFKVWNLLEEFKIKYRNTVPLPERGIMLLDEMEKIEAVKDYFKKEKYFFSHDPDNEIERELEKGASYWIVWKKKHRSNDPWPRFPIELVKIMKDSITSINNFPGETILSMGKIKPSKTQSHRIFKFEDHFEVIPEHRGAASGKRYGI